jgi:hypothetical protein
MNRQQRRQDEREETKARKRLYTYDECRRIALTMLAEENEQHKKSLAEQKAKYEAMLAEQQETIKQKYDTLYTLASVCALHAEPFKFGKKRIGEFVNLFFGQVDGLIDKTIEPEQLLETTKSLGITVENVDGKFVVNIN